MLYALKASYNDLVNIETTSSETSFEWSELKAVLGFAPIEVPLEIHPDQALYLKRKYKNNCVFESSIHYAFVLHTLEVVLEIFYDGKQVFIMRIEDLHPSVGL